MAALYAMGVDNCLIEVNAPEFPILDGSARGISSEKMHDIFPQPNKWYVSDVVPVRSDY